MSISGASVDQFEEQIALEESMVTYGANRFKERFQKAAAKGRVSQTSAGLRIQGGGVLPISEGIASWLEEIQRPILTRTTNRASKSKKLPKLEDKGVRLQIITGLEAIGRGQDLMRLDTALSGVSKFVPVEQLGQYTKVEKLIEKYLLANGVDAKEIMHSSAELAAIQQQSQQQAMIAQLGPEAIRQIGGVAQANMKSGPQQ